MSDELNLGEIREQLQGISKTLEKLTEVPSTAPESNPLGVEDQPTGAPSRGVSKADLYAMRSELRKKSTNELMAMFSLQARKSQVGVPFDTWAAAGGAPVQTAIEGEGTLTKALDTTGATALIRQDLEPILYELYIRSFPAWDRFAKEPANGLVHAYNRQTSFGDAQFMTELGTVTDDTSAYERATTPVSVIATRRGISLRSKFAVQAGGAGFNPEQLELAGGLRAIAHKMQKTIFQGNSTTSSGTSSDEIGAYDANAFDGLRGILNTGRAKNVNPLTGTDEDLRQAIDRAVEEVVEQGGTGSCAVYLHPHDTLTLDFQQESKTRWVAPNLSGAVGTTVSSVNTILGALPLSVVPGDSIGTYTASAVSRRDIYLLDEQTISMPYLGTDGPTVLDIPIGISGQLTHLFIIFGMWGLAVKVVPFSNKVRVRQA
jgi:hypothetical protein